MASEENPWRNFNRQLKRWAKVTEQSMKSRISSRSGELKGSIGIKTYNDKITRRLEAMRFLFARHGVFLELGVGKYRPVKSPAADAAKKPWLRPTLAARQGELERIVQATSAEAAAEMVENVLPLSIRIVMR